MKIRQQQQRKKKKKKITTNLIRTLEHIKQSIEYLTRLKTPLKLCYSLSNKIYLYLLLSLIIFQFCLLLILLKNVRVLWRHAGLEHTKQNHSLTVYIIKHSLFSETLTIGTIDSTNTVVTIYQLFPQVKIQHQQKPASKVSSSKTPITGTSGSINIVEMTGTSFPKLLQTAHNYTQIIFSKNFAKKKSYLAHSSYVL
ncbi:hypothetical protein BpHYR1_045521 [Brachionus plicatilis]|uniref:Transmembrane protein n=1 Tax=Brachionus plicatilis TaxID=10195 RepID=A0A3M7SGD8_BRAPC|nr:hypothetical protein BpHYR1_045521 [Brachionus plicatilis]